MKKCRFCNEEKPFVKSHIIPKAFFKMINQSKIASKIISTKLNSNPTKSPDGVYDSFILCEECEKIFQDWDDYAIKTLRPQSPSKEKLYIDEIDCGINIKIDYDKMKLFFISLLWRAHISSNPFYGKVNVGKHEKKLKEMIKNKNPGLANEYAVIGWLLHDDPEVVSIFSPYKTKSKNITCYMFVFSGFAFSIKVASHNYPAEFQKYTLKPGNNWQVSKYDYRSSKFYETAVSMVNMQIKPVFSDNAMNLVKEENNSNN